MRFVRFGASPSLLQNITVMQRVEAALLPTLLVIKIGEEITTNPLLMAKVSILLSKYVSSSLSKAADYCAVSPESVGGRFLEASFPFGGTQAENALNGAGDTFLMSLDWDS